MPELQVSQALEPVSELRWLFLDLNSYFASVEQQENPALRGKPVAVVPMMADSTCAIAASYEAKAYGVKTGTPVYEAKKMCPGLKLVLARHDVYVDYHHRIFEEVIKHTPSYPVVYRQVSAIQKKRRWSLSVLKRAYARMSARL